MPGQVFQQVSIYKNLRTYPSFRFGYMFFIADNRPLFLEVLTVHGNELYLFWPRLSPFFESLLNYWKLYLNHNCFFFIKVNKNEKKNQRNKNFCLFWPSGPTKKGWSLIFYWCIHGQQSISYPSMFDWHSYLCLFQNS